MLNDLRITVYFHCVLMDFKGILFRPIKVDEIPRQQCVSVGRHIMIIIETSEKTFHDVYGLFIYDKVVNVFVDLPVAVLTPHGGHHDSL